MAATKQWKQELIQAKIQQMRNYLKYYIHEVDVCQRVIGGSE
jgi:hypothetical protein